MKPLKVRMRKSGESRRYYYRNRERILERKRAYYAANRAARLDYARRYHIETRPEARP